MNNLVGRDLDREFPQTYNKYLQNNIGIFILDFGLKIFYVIKCVVIMFLEV